MGGAIPAQVGASKVPLRWVPSASMASTAPVTRPAPSASSQTLPPVASTEVPAQVTSERETAAAARVTTVVPVGSWVMVYFPGGTPGGVFSAPRTIVSVMARCWPWTGWPYQGAEVAHVGAGHRHDGDPRRWWPPLAQTPSAPKLSESTGVTALGPVAPMGPVGRASPESLPPHATRTETSTDRSARRMWTSADEPLSIIPHLAAGQVSTSPLPRRGRPGWASGCRRGWTCRLPVQQVPAEPLALQGVVGQGHHDFVVVGVDAAQVAADAAAGRPGEDPGDLARGPRPPRRASPARR